MALHILREEESFWKDHDDPNAKDSLQRTYGNQALILKAWGRLEEALALHKKKEALCLELGNKASLGYCYWNWGLLARDLKDKATEREKLQAALQIFTELNMPRERDAVQNELEKTSKPSRSSPARV
jgi:tetratricopeptide (TPR) repeat protein